MRYYGIASALKTILEIQDKRIGLPTFTAIHSRAHETCFEACETVINGLIKDYGRLPQGPELVNIIARYSMFLYTEQQCI